MYPGHYENIKITLKHDIQIKILIFIEQIQADLHELKDKNLDNFHTLEVS